MKKLWILAASLIAVALMFACNKTKPHKLQYNDGKHEELYDPQGMPGESHVGGTRTDFKYSGYDHEGDAKGGEKKPEEKKPEEKKPEEKKPEEKKPEEKKPEEKKEEKKEEKSG